MKKRIFLIFGICLPFFCYSVGNIRIISTESGFSVFLDEKLQGEAPLTISNVTEGNHVIKIMPPDIALDIQKLTVAVVKGKTIEIKINKGQSSIVSFVNQNKKEKDRVGVLRFIAKGGVSAAEADVVEELFRSELVEDGAWDILDRNNMNKILKEQSFQQSGCTENECAVKIGQLLNMQYMVYGNLMKIGESFFVSVGMVNVETGQIYKTAREKFTDINDVDTIVKNVVLSLGSKPAIPTIDSLPESTGQPTIMTTSKVPEVNPEVEKLFKRGRKLKRYGNFNIMIGIPLTLICGVGLPFIIIGACQRVIGKNRIKDSERLSENFSSPEN